MKKSVIFIGMSAISMGVTAFMAVKEVKRKKHLEFLNKAYKDLARDYSELMEEYEELCVSNEKNEDIEPV